MSEFRGTIVNGEGAINGMIDNKAFVVSRDNSRYEELVAAFNANDADKFAEILATPDTSLQDAQEELGKSFTDGSVAFDAVTGKLTYNGEPVVGRIVQTLQNMVKMGFNHEPLVLFFKNLMLNPSYNSVKQLFEFIDNDCLSITPDGYFLAMKSVTEDYLDKWTRTIDYRPGAVVEMPRHKVEDDPNKACGAGLHAGAMHYAGPNGWYNGDGDKVIIVKINPKDVVCVPHDASHGKIRCCSLEVVDDFAGELCPTIYDGEDVRPVAGPIEKVNALTLDGPDDMMVGWEYSFRYTKRDGTTGIRHARLDEIQDNDHYLMELLEPEIDAGEYRTFRAHEMENIQEYDKGEFTEPEDNDCCDYDYVFDDALYDYDEDDDIDESGPLM